MLLLGTLPHLVLQCVAVCCSVLQCVAVCCSALQRVSVCCVVNRCCNYNVTVGYSPAFGAVVNSSVLQCVAVCCSVLQRVATCCNVLQYESVLQLLCQY